MSRRWWIPTRRWAPASLQGVMSDYFEVRVRFVLDREPNTLSHLHNRHQCLLSSPSVIWFASWTFASCLCYCFCCLSQSWAFSRAVLASRPSRSPVCSSASCPFPCDLFPVVPSSGLCYKYVSLYVIEIVRETNLTSCRLTTWREWWSGQVRRYQFTEEEPFCREGARL